VQLARDVVHTFVVSQDPLGDGLAYLAYKALHIEVLEYKTDDGMCEQVCRCQGEHNTRGDIDERLVKVRRKLNKGKVRREK